MYAIIATDSDNIDCVRKNIVDKLAPSMGENVTQDMEAIEYVVDDVNALVVVHVYLGFGISPAAAKEECVHNAFAYGLPADNMVNGCFHLTYFQVALIPNHDPYVGKVCSSAIRFQMALCATFADATTAIDACELSMPY